MQSLARMAATPSTIHLRSHLLFAAGAITLAWMAACGRSDAARDTTPAGVKGAAGAAGGGGQVTLHDGGGNGGLAGRGGPSGSGGNADGGRSSETGGGTGGVGNPSVGSGGAAGRRVEGSGGVENTGGAGDGLSIEFGRKQWGNDYTLRSDVPKGGTLFTIWTKVPDPGSSYPWSRGNMDVYVLKGNSWYFRCLVGNTSANSATDARYNANTMLFANPGDTWVGDYSAYESGDGHPEAPHRDWVWVAWHVVVNANAFQIRQWLRLGTRGNVFAAGESTPTFAEIRAILVSNGWTQTAANAWAPGDAESFAVGRDNGYLTQARMFARSTVPSLAELDAISRSDAATGLVWADYPLDWVRGGPNLDDRSGNRRHLKMADQGKLYQGPPGPAF